MTTPAQDEFNALFAEDKGGKRHPEDDRSSISSAHSKDDHSYNPSSGKGRSRAKQGTPPDSEDDENSATPSSSNMRTKYFLPRTHRENANTGPKGVIADAYAFENAKKNARRISFLPSRQPSFQPTPPPAQYRREPEKSDGSEEDDEDEFMQRWRQFRLKELQQAAIPGVGSRKTSPSGRRWGNLTTVDGEGYLDAVERSARGSVVVVLIYDDSSDVSTLVDSSLRQLARAHATTRFIRLNYEEAEMESMGVPAILAYRDGDKFAGLVPVVDEIPAEQELNADSLEMAMRKHQILL
ncbi:thioredoxin-like protein [Rhizodiscina lignyota]|uniref:Thioredoxin-like protein n=1 Tax=Rhizodiscina lignyota TaxID=1504668 RepID=A0A9P4MBB1_9PEZI|nr:thioredoxin-like protein [Rhizodiscina lignyota]